MKGTKVQTLGAVACARVHYGLAFVCQLIGHSVVATTLTRLDVKLAHARKLTRLVR